MPRIETEQGVRRRLWSLGERWRWLDARRKGCGGRGVWEKRGQVQPRPNLLIHPATPRQPWKDAREVAEMRCIGLVLEHLHASNLLRRLVFKCCAPPSPYLLVSAWSRQTLRERFILHPKKLHIVMISKMFSTQLSKINTSKKRCGGCVRVTSSAVGTIANCVNLPGRRCSAGYFLVMGEASFEGSMTLTSSTITSPTHLILRLVVCFALGCAGQLVDTFLCTDMLMFSFTYSPASPLYLLVIMMPQYKRYNEIW